jgi:hypothetical protein
MKKINQLLFPPKPNLFFCTIIDFENKIFALNTYVHLHHFCKLIYPKAKGSVYIYCGLWNSHENIKDALFLYLVVLKNKILFPRIRLVILCNTIGEYNMLKRFKLSCVYCNHNAFLDENTFIINSHIKKIFKTVYNAVLLEFKRHYLCECLDNLILLTYNFKNAPYKEYLTKLLKGATWANYETEDASPRFFNNTEIVNVYNSAKVGLALSKSEGAMYSSTEYLLCGLPIVSTESFGGRDVFFTSYNSLICNDDKKDVFLKVEEMINRNVDPYKIRSECLVVMEEHRNRFIESINNIYRSEGIGIDAKITWVDWFVNKLRNEYSHKDIERIFK